jgi:dipeptidyl aminopeptidase/acylaminoacyl peptidase
MSFFNKMFFTAFFIFLFFNLVAQEISPNTSELKIRTIMQGANWIGESPSNVFWSDDSKSIYLDWNIEKEPFTSLYKITTENHTPQKVNNDEKYWAAINSASFNNDRSKKVFEKSDDVFMKDLNSGITTQITKTIAKEQSPEFNHAETKIIYSTDNNLFTWSIETGQIEQLTNFVKGQDDNQNEKERNLQEQWLYEDQLRLFPVLSERKEKQELKQKMNKTNISRHPKEFYTGNDIIFNMKLSPDEQYVTFLSLVISRGENTIVPNFVTNTGYTESQSARAKVGSVEYKRILKIFDRQRDTVYDIQTKNLPGLDKIPEFLADYPEKDFSWFERKVTCAGVYWSDNGNYAMVELRTLDHKDRWIALLDLNTGILDILDHQHDEAWIGGPGIESLWDDQGIGWLSDNEHVWFQSEATGYSHLYKVNIKNKKKTALTSGEYEIRNAQLSMDGKYFYFSSNEPHPGERQFYRLTLKNGKKERITTLEGNNEVVLSPDETMLAIRYSYYNKPWELFLMENKPGAEMKQITHSTSEEFNSYKWRIPELITFEARDKAKVYARLYTPSEEKKINAAIIFVHGAGYLQNAHKWWSSYYREYMFHNILADNGYIVLDIDYRGSEGYGRDWRTGIYRHMGGKDLTDQIDGAKYLIENHEIYPESIGMYGGSYGGFITLMALFKESETFAAGAALRSVTDWAHYNHGYTSNILNTPVLDSLAFVRSSPIYYAEGLNDPLLILHGMVDDNVQFQDVIRLAERLIELEKENWELAVFPVEPHSFKEPTSWGNEYRRIFKHFQQHLNSKK